MKFTTSHILVFFNERRTQRNIRSLVKFLLILCALIVTYSILFHFIMMHEDQQHSWVTGFYWTLTVMSTLGFGDITFESDLGRIFSMIVLGTGIVFLLVLLPFTIIQFFYAPWVEAQAAARTPRELPADTEGHVILTRYDAVTTALIRKLSKFEHDYVLISPDFEDASRLHDMGLRVVFAPLDDPETYRRVRADRAALVATTHDDVVNTNVAFMVRQVAPDIPIIATCKSDTSEAIMRHAGATRVLRLSEMMGRALARCMVGGDAITHEVGRLDELIIAEANAHRTPLVGKTLRENRLRDLGVSVIGLWDRGDFRHATPESMVNDSTILMLAGSEQQFERYDEHFVIYNVSVKPVVILGGGRVGRAAAEALSQRGVGWTMVDLIEERIPDEQTGAGGRGIVGDARDPEVLERAGLFDAPAVLITTHEDSLNTYLTIYCRSVRPDIQIISRATLERTAETMHSAGADFVHSYASMGAMHMLNLIKGDRIVTVTEGLDIFRVPAPKSLHGVSLLESGVRESTGCTIVAVRAEDGTLSINPPAETKLQAGHEIVMAGDESAETAFLARYSE
ncbi:MAG: potassium channel family protein [Phycisphaerales bacterium JB040]